jgi:hypothetical protein
MTAAAPQLLSEPSDAPGRVRLAIVPAHPDGRARVGRGSPVELGVAQAALAAVLALAASFLEARGVAQLFLLGAASLVLVVSGPLLVVWSDPDDGANPAA